MSELLRDGHSLSNANSLWGAFVAECLARLGVERVVISPGSRSTPLTFGCARHARLQVTPVLDERSAAFFALGLAQASRRPVALICTSGTAGAHYYPALIEARESGLPLLVLTADRPPELRHCRAGQTIDQQKLFGSYPSFYAELPLPEATPEALRNLRQTLQHAVERSRWPVPGPVHLNLPFRDPLVPGQPYSLNLSFAPEALLNDLRPLPATPKAALQAVPELGGVPGVIVAGPSKDPPGEHVAAVAALAQALGWPVLADGLSPCRHAAEALPGLVSHYDLLLRSPRRAAQLAPEQVLQVGDLPTSKVLRAWLAGLDRLTWVVSTLAADFDAARARATHLRLSVAELAALAPSLPTLPEAVAWQRQWTSAEAAMASRLDSRLAEAQGLFEGLVARHLVDWLPPGTPLFIASSMPVRDWEWFCPANDRRCPVFFNRGANGIDGTLSTALGVAEATGTPAALLTGDLALLHDTNGWLLGPRMQSALTVICLNNQGGGIFQHLPIASFDPPFEDYWATPQTVDFGKLAAAYEVEHHRIERLEDLALRLAEPVVPGLRLLEVICHRREDAAFRRELFSALATD